MRQKERIRWIVDAGRREDQTVVRGRALVRRCVTCHLQAGGLTAQLIQFLYVAYLGTDYSAKQGESSSV